MPSRRLLVAGLLLAPALLLPGLFAPAHVAAQSGRGFDPILSPRRASSAPSTLTPEQVEALRGGAELIRPASADAGGLPSPSQALEAAGELALSAEQIATITALRSTSVEDAQRLGRAIVEHESRLDSILAAGDPRDWSVRPIVVEIGRLATELRYVHLRARMRMREILSETQQRRFAEITGNR